MSHFLPGDPIPTAADWNAIAREMKSRIIGDNKTVKVHAFNNKLVVDKIKRRIKKRVPNYEVYTHGAFCIEENTWDDSGFTAEAWNTLVTEYKKYNKRGSHFTIASFGFSVADLLPPDDIGAYELPLDNFSFVQMPISKTQAELDTHDCNPGCGVFMCYGGTCRPWYLDTDPNDNADDEYWVYSGLDAGSGAIFTTYTNAIITAINALQSPLETYFYYWGREPAGVYINFTGFTIEEWLKYILTWIWGGLGQSPQASGQTQTTFWLQAIVNYYLFNNKK